MWSQMATAMAGRGALWALADECLVGARQRLYLQALEGLLCMPQTTLQHDSQQ